MLLVASVLLPAAQLFTLTGIYLGLKFFVLDFIFFRYPRIRLKYDTTSRLWDTLPTDADLERRAEKVGSGGGNGRVGWEGNAGCGKGKERKGSRSGREGTVGSRVEGGVNVP